MHDAPEARYEGFRGFFYALEADRLDEERALKARRAPQAPCGFESHRLRR